LGLALLAPTVAQAQNAEIRGRVRDDEGAAVRAGVVQVIVAGEEQPIRAAETGSLGSYSVQGLAAGTYELRALAFGFEEATRTVTVFEQDLVQVDFTLARSAVPIEGVEVEAERSRDRARFEETAGLTALELDAEELKLIPGLAESDPVRAVEVLPGVVSTSDFQSAFNVRGGSADQNLILLDGVTIYNPFHLGGLFSVFNSDMVARAELQAGGYPAQYGGRVSSVLNIQTDPGDGHFGVDMGISAIAARAAVRGGLPRGLLNGLGLSAGRWRVSGRRSYFDVVLKPVFEMPYHLTDLQGAFEGWTEGGHRWSFTGYTGDDVLNLTTLDEEDFPLRVFWKWGNDALGGRWNRPLGRGSMLEARAGYSRFDTELSFPDFQDSVFRSRIDQLFAGLDVETPAGRRWTLRTGADIERTTYDNLAISGGTEFARGLGSGVRFGTFLQGVWKPSRPWLLELGLRNDAWFPDPGDTEVVVAPRVGVKRFFAGGDGAVKLSLGRYAQFLQSVRDEELPLGLDVWILAGERAPPVVSDQIQLGLEGYPRENWFTSVEGYYRTFDGLITNNLADDPNDRTDDFLEGDGFSYGIDVMIRKEGRGVTGWIAASWLRAERTFPDFRSGLEDPPDISYAPIFDRRLDVDLVLRADVMWGINAGIRWNLGTGVPYTRPIGGYSYLSPQLVSGGRLTPDTGAGDRAVILGPRNGERYPTYHRLDLSFRKTYTPSWGVITPYVEILNLYDRRNVLFYFFQYEDTPPTRSGVSNFPFFPTIGVEISF
jgi:hypothetical protein